MDSSRQQPRTAGEDDGEALIAQDGAGNFDGVVLDDLTGEGTVL